MADPNPTRAPDPNATRAPDPSPRSPDSNSRSSTRRLGPEVTRANPFPENELPKWLLRKAAQASGRARFLFRAPPYKQLAQFSHDLGMCIRSSADLPRGLELCLKPLANTKLGNLWSGSVDRVREGVSLHDALEPGADYLPPFFLPIIRAGEQSGRLVEAFAFLTSHCKLLAGPASTIRNLWFFPLVILLFGSVLRIGITFLMGGIGEGTATAFLELLSWLQLGVVVAVVMLTPVRYFFDQVRLSVPMLGALEREIAVHRFFRVMALLYSVGSIRVEEMIRMAAQTVGNHAARIDLLRAAEAIENQSTVPDAFQRVKILTESERACIDVGDLSGALEVSFDQIADETGASLIAKIKYVEPILFRVMTALVALSVISTFLRFLI